jgi:predicted HicB family RNase H-like nuclease
MSEDDEEQGTSISQAHTLEKIADFWDTHSLDDYWEQTHEAAFEVRAKRRRCVALDPDIYEHVAVQARARGISPTTLVNLCLAERLKDASSAAG